jgi:hypothetical protein
MSGDPDPLYVLARRALLDGLAALEPHLTSIVVIGAQAIYLHTGPSDLAVAEFTTDADLAIGPEFLATAPSITGLLEANGFELQGDPGKWKTADGVQVDLLVPDEVAGPGRRGARLPGHGKRAARRTRGIEGALVESELRDLTALDPTDTRSFRVAVAGPAALFIAKVHKIAERIDQPDRLVEKDALDLLRLLRAIPTNSLASGLRRLADTEIAAAVTVEAIDHADTLLTDAEGPGARMAARAVGDLEAPLTVAMSLVALVGDLLADYHQPR